MKLLLFAALMAPSKLQTPLAPSDSLPADSASRVGRNGGGAGALGVVLSGFAQWRERRIRLLEERGRYANWVLIAALAGMFATTFPVTILTLSLSSIATEFDTSKTLIAWVISAPMLLSAVALPLLGKLGDLRGHRRVFLMGFSGATLVAALTATAWDASSLIGFRTLAAVLGGATQPTSMALIFSVYAPEDRVRAMGWWSMTGAAAPALGLVAGGPLVDWLGWRIVFVVQALLSAGALLLAAVVLRETAQKRVRFDVRGGVALAAAVSGLMVVLAGVRDLALPSWALFGAGAVGVSALFDFVRVERSASEPLLPLSFFRQRGFTAPIISNSCMSAAYMGAFVIAPFVLQDQFQFSVSLAAGIMLMRTISLSAASPLGGSLAQYVGQRSAAMIGSAILMTGLMLMAFGVRVQRVAVVGVALVLQGLGHGLCLPSLTASISNSVPSGDLGAASAANRLTGQLGSALGITLLTLVGTSAPGATGLMRAFLLGAVFAGLSWISATRMARTDPHLLGSADEAR